MATAAQAPTTPTDPVERWLARRGVVAQLHEDQLDTKVTGSPAPSLPANSSEAQRARRAPSNKPKISLRRAPFCANSLDEERAATNRANSLHSTGPRTESGKQRSSRNALSRGLTARTAILPTEDPEAHQRHIQQFLDEYQPANSTETQLVHEIANTTWRLNRIPFLEADLLSQDLDPQSQIPLLASLGVHGSRLSRQFQKAVEQLRDIQEERRRKERRQLNEAADLLLRHQRKGLPWTPAPDDPVFSKQAGFVFSKDQIERHAQHLMRQNPAFYAPNPHFQADPPPTQAAL